MPAPVHDPQFLVALERVRVTFGWTLADVAAALSTHERTLYRWRAGTAAPSRAVTERLDELRAVVDALARVYGADAHGPSATLRAWLVTPLALLGGACPDVLLRAGRAALVHALLAMRGGGLSAPWRPEPAPHPAPRAVAPRRDAQDPPRSGQPSDRSDRSAGRPAPVRERVRARAGRSVATGACR